MAIAQVRTVKNVLFFSKSDKEAIRKNAGKMAAILCNRNLLEGFDKLDISEYYLLREISPIFEEMDKCYNNTEDDVADQVLIVADEIKAFLATLPPQKIEAKKLEEAFEEENSIINEELDQYGTASDLLCQLLAAETISDEAKQEIVDTIFN